MLTGLAKRRALRKGRSDQSQKGDLGGLIRYLVGHKKILRNPYVGISHILMFWGVIIPIAIVVISQFGLTMPRVPSQILSFATDVLGVAMLAGTLFFLVRRIRRPKEERGLRNPNLPLLVFLFILLTGFLAEGARLSIVHPTFSGISPVGSLFSFLLPESPRLMQLMIRIHFFGVLLFIAMIPFTFMRHLPAAALNVYFKKQRPRGELKGIELDGGSIGAAYVTDFTPKQLLDAEACVSCGRCEENCPATISGKPLSPKKIMRDICELMEVPESADSAEGGLFQPPLEARITGDEIWSCTNCMACEAHCPVYIDPMDKIIDMRRSAVMGRGALPKEAQPVIRNLEIYGDVQGRGAAHRIDWALSQDVPQMSNGAPLRNSDGRVLLWVGCSGAFHPRYQEVARAMVKILKAGGVEFAVYGKRERCCGDPARRLGDEALFLNLARMNMKHFLENGIQKIVALCPHCFNTLKNDYPGLTHDPEFRSGSPIEVNHAAEFVWDLIQQGRIVLKYPARKRVALHDPCYLGRVNHIYEPLRALIRAVPETALKELESNRESGFCCGGGGGRMWLHEKLGQNINRFRSEQIHASNVETVATACPYCLTMLDDGVKSLETENPPDILDILEMVASSVG